MNLQNNKHALITGGSSGIGLATAKEFARRGVNLNIIARNTDRLLNAKSDIEATYDVEVRVFSCDVTDFSSLQMIINDIGQNSKIDYLVCSAGIMICGRIEDNSMSDLNRIMEINYNGVLNTYKATIEIMKNQREGQIGFVSSVAGYLGAIGYGGYAPGKFAITGLAECVRMEAADYGIGTTIIYPPDTTTPFLKWEQENTLPECRALSKNAKAIPAEKVAKKLVEAMIKNKFEVFCSSESKIIRVLKVIWPSLYFNIVDGIVRKDRKKRGVL